MSRRVVWCGVVWYGVVSHRVVPGWIAPRCIAPRPVAWRGAGQGGPTANCATACPSPLLGERIWAVRIVAAPAHTKTPHGSAILSAQLDGFNSGSAAFGDVVQARERSHFLSLA